MTYQPEASQAPAAPAAVYQSETPRPALPTTLAYTNTYALLAIILAFLAPVAGIVFGHLALGQIKRNGDAGRGIALTGLILGYAYIALIAMILVAYIGMIIVMFASFGAAMNGLDFDPYAY